MSVLLIENGFDSEWDRLGGSADDSEHKDQCLLQPDAPYSACICVYVYVPADAAQPYTDTHAQTLSCTLNRTLEQTAEVSDLSTTVIKI